MVDVNGRFDDEGIGIGEGMEIGIGLNEEYSLTLPFDFNFELVSKADVDFRVELEALLLALTGFEVTGLTIMRYISSTLICSALKTDLIQLFDSVRYTYLFTPAIKKRSCA